MRLTSWALPDVMVVTLPRDVSYGNAFQLSAYFGFSGRCEDAKGSTRRLGDSEI